MELKEKISGVCEGFKGRTQKKFPDRPGKIYGVTSGKGGVGKTSFAAALSYGVAAQGYETLVVDLDTGLRNLDIVMGVDAYIVHNLFDVLDRGEPFENAVLKAPGTGRDAENEKLPWICVSVQDKPKDSIDPAALMALLEELRNMFDVIILDGPAGIEDGAKLVTACADEYFIVCTPSNASVRGADQVNRLQADLTGGRPACVVVNMVIPEVVESGGGLTTDDIEDFMQLPVAVSIPMDVVVGYCGHNGLSVWNAEEDCLMKGAIQEFIKEKFPDLTVPDGAAAHAEEAAEEVPEPAPVPDEAEESERTPEEADGVPAAPQPGAFSRFVSKITRLFGAGRREASAAAEKAEEAGEEGGAGE